MICVRRERKVSNLLLLPAFEYTTCDPLGLCDTALVTITVDPTNDDPIVFDDRESTPEDEPAVVDVLANDIPDIGLEVTEVTQPENGVCEIGQGGTVVYSPEAGFVGQDECMCECSRPRYLGWCLLAFDLRIISLLASSDLVDTACAEGTTDCDEGTLIVDVIEVPKQPPVSIERTPPR